MEDQEHESSEFDDEFSDQEAEGRSILVRGIYSRD